MPYTIYDKIWNEHLVHEQEDGTSLLFVDRHLIHEVTSPQAFEGLRNSKRKVRQPKLTLAVADHNVPTTDRTKGISDHESKIQVETLDKNCKEFGIQIFEMNDKRLIDKLVKYSASIPDSFFSMGFIRFLYRFLNTPLCLFIKN